MKLVRKLISIAGAASLAGTLAFAASPAQARPQNTTLWGLVDNYGGNAYGWLTDAGHNVPLRACNQGSCPHVTGVDAWFFPPSGYSGWTLIESNLTGDCANEVDGSTNIVYSDTCTSLDTHEAWRQVGTYTWENRHTGTSLTALGLSNGAEIIVAGGPASGENQWAATALNAPLNARIPLLPKVQYRQAA